MTVELGVVEDIMDAIDMEGGLTGELSMVGLEEVVILLKGRGWSKGFVHPEPTATALVTADTLTAAAGPFAFVVVEL